MKEFRDILDVIVGFNENTYIDNESDVNKLIASKKSMIEKIREEIKNGKIVKVKKPDGTYVWKKVKK
jgi:hypothetical protein